MREAVNGREGIQKALELKPDVIVLDFQMPDMDELEVATVLRQRMPDVPRILFTLYADAVTESSARSFGITAVIDKSNLARLVRFTTGLLLGG